VSLKDAEHLSKPCLGLSKECLCIGLHLSDLLSYVFGIFQESAAPFCKGSGIRMPDRTPVGWLPPGLEKKKKEDITLTSPKILPLEAHFSTNDN